MEFMDIFYVALWICGGWRKYGYFQYENEYRVHLRILVLLVLI